MFKILLTSTMIMTTCVPLVKTPLTMGMVIFMQTVIICSLTRMISMSSWLPFTMFLVMASGLMIIFMYVTSICSNKKFSFIKMNMIFLMPILIMFMWLKDIFYFPYKDNLQIKDLFNHEFLKLYTHMNIFSSTFMFMYLLLMLIIMINLLLLNKGPMRKKY
uniref:NADH dehydrogenase subunit 6 n=1 Tax=Pariaconus pele TaxID=1950172 RepID=A0A344A2N1_9HEMI|nr:NADH dehydrogenase subunit 6 [Pariaconus pele]AWU49022.1 NADH dehydrogenase subunit 6 [Pariaconus pele]